jgi:hypothetical protein
MSEFEQELRQLAEKLPVTASKMQNITKVAIKSVVYIH